MDEQWLFRTSPASPARRIYIRRRDARFSLRNLDRPRDAPGASFKEKLSPKGTGTRGKRPRDDVLVRTLSRVAIATYSGCTGVRYEILDRYLVDLLAILSGTTILPVDGEHRVHDSGCCVRFFPRRRRRT